MLYKKLIFGQYENPVTPGWQTYKHSIKETNRRARTKWIIIKVIQPSEPWSVWLNNSVDGHDKFRKLKLSRDFFSPGVQLKAENSTDRKLRGRHDIPLDEMSFQPTIEKVEWLFCSGWKRKVITLGARGGNSWVQIKWRQDFCRGKRAKEAIKCEFGHHSSMCLSFIYI